MKSKKHSLTADSNNKEQYLQVGMELAELVVGGIDGLGWMAKYYMKKQ